MNLIDPITNLRMTVYLGENETFGFYPMLTRSLDSGTALPLAADVALEMRGNHAAPLAIWLGITLDGIPESLVIGASLINSNISLSLITRSMKDWH